MTKHNGRARKAGIRVGQALVAALKKGGKGSGVIAGVHTTDIHGPETNMQSVLERNDLEEIMAMADLAGRDFTAEKSNVIVISSGNVDPKDAERAAAERAATEERHRHRLRIPRRPAWDENTTPDQLDAEEKSTFLEWRRDLADLEEQERLILTPFEKNLEVWRQLWRVLERSDIVVQVVDARDPMLYRCDDLEAYAQQLHKTKTSLLLLNKADLLPPAARAKWAEYLDKVGISYAFWSAWSVMEEHAALKVEAQDLGLDWHDLREQQHHSRRLHRLAAEAKLQAEHGEAAVEAARRIHILNDDELIDLLESKARQAVSAAGPNDPRAKDSSRRLMVGLVGYPNVGKSSTINALFGAKKTAVAPTPGKTKHFQTLIVSPTLCLCDCPGLVMPKFARSKAEMVVAGVIPIDRLTEIRAPVEVLTHRLGRGQFEQLYGLRLPPPPPHMAPSTPPTAAQLLRSLASLRGWVVGSGLPDESRAGRQLLRDYTTGKLLHVVLPPGSNPDCYVPLIHDPHTLKPLATPPGNPLRQASVAASASANTPQPLSSSTAPSAAAQQQQQRGQSQSIPEDPESDSEDPDAVAGDDDANRGLNLAELDAADLDLLAGELGGLGIAGASSSKAVHPKDVFNSKPKRAEHKFHKKAARTKGDRGVNRSEGAYDGGGLMTGKKGGLVRVTGY